MSDSLWRGRGVTQKDFKQIIFLLLLNEYRVARMRQEVTTGMQEGPWGEGRKVKGQSSKLALGFGGTLAARPRSRLLWQHMWPLCGTLCPCVWQSPTEPAISSAPLQTIHGRVVGPWELHAVGIWKPVEKCRRRETILYNVFSCSVHTLWYGLSCVPLLQNTRTP